MKRAFTLIELIISIVIIGIASAALPLMLSSANKLEEQTINQDIFFKSVMVMTDILSKSWDKRPEINVSNNQESNTSDANQTLIWYLPHNNPKKDDNLTGKKGPKIEGNFLYRYGSVVGNATNRMFYAKEDENTSASDIPEGSTELSRSSIRNYINEYNDNYFVEESEANVRYDIKVRYVDDRVDDPKAKRQRAVWKFSSSDGSTKKSDSTNLKRINIKATRDIGGEKMEVEFVYFKSNIGMEGYKPKI